MRAVRFLASFFEQTGCEALAGDHPLHNRFLVGFEPNYQWLTQYARKLITVSSFSGFEQVAKRLGNSKEFLPANNEIEVALKLHLEGLPVSFARFASAPIPDVLTIIDGQTVRMEVSSLNRPDYEKWNQMFLNHLLGATFVKGLMSGGYLNTIKSFSILQEAIVQVNEAIERVKQSGNIEKLNIQGVATVYLATQEKASQLPEDCRGSYRFTGPYSRPLQEQIIRKIGEKARQASGRNESGILFLNTQLADRQSLSELFEAAIDDVEVVLAAYPKLQGLVLTIPHLGIGVVSSVETHSLSEKYNGNKILLESEVGVYQYESSIIWKNKHPDQGLSDKVLSALRSYSRNLVHLAPLQDSFVASL
jgi:hypothetical protein